MDGLGGGGLIGTCPLKIPHQIGRGCSSRSGSAETVGYQPTRSPSPLAQILHLITELHPARVDQDEPS
jgi:hypothetical protein